VLMQELFGKNMPDIQKTPVCFEKLLVGTPMLSDDCMEARHLRHNFGSFLMRFLALHRPTLRAPARNSA